MPPAPPPENDAARVAVLRQYGIEPGVADEALDGVARAASRVLGVPMGLVTLVDHDAQGLPGAHGWGNGRITSREAAFCGHTILGGSVLEVGDALHDARFADNVLVTGAPHLRFYAGAPLVTPEGHKLGSVCGLDTRPGCLAPWQREVLEDLARTVIDILEGYRRQNALAARKQQTDRLTALGELSAGMAHEINNALQPLVGLTGVLKENADPASRMARLLTTMESSALYARDVVRDVLAFARSDSEAVEAQDAPRVFDDAVTFVERLMPADLAIAREGFDAVGAEDERPRVRVSYHGAVQVVQNLVRNAADAMDDSGTVVVRLGRGELAETADAATRPAVTLTICDEAPAIDADTRRRMFDPFFTTKPVNKGSGLGLSTVLGLVRGWGGEITVESGAERGNCFTVMLPVAS
jgi:signal transduction histidine kinase